MKHAAMLPPGAGAGAARRGAAGKASSCLPFFLRVFFFRDRSFWRAIENFSAEKKRREIHNPSTPALLSFVLLPATTPRAPPRSHVHRRFRLPRVALSPGAEGESARSAEGCRAERLKSKAKQKRETKFLAFLFGVIASSERKENATSAPSHPPRARAPPLSIAIPAHPFDIPPTKGAPGSSREHAAGRANGCARSHRFRYLSSSVAVDLFDLTSFLLTPLSKKKKNILFLSSPPAPRPAAPAPSPSARASSAPPRTSS